MTEQSYPISVKPFHQRHRGLNIAMRSASISPDNSSCFLEVDGSQASYEANVDEDGKVKVAPAGLKLKGRYWEKRKWTVQNWVHGFLGERMSRINPDIIWDRREVKPTGVGES